MAVKSYQVGTGTSKALYRQCMYSDRRYKNDHPALHRRSLSRQPEQGECAILTRVQITMTYFLYVIIIINVCYYYWHNYFGCGSGQVQSSPRLL